MTLMELRSLYQNNQLVEAIIEPVMQDGSWIVEFRSTDGDLVLLTDEEGEGCRYIDLDLASRSAMAVGFNQVRIEENK